MGCPAGRFASSNSSKRLQMSCYTSVGVPRLPQRRPSAAKAAVTAAATAVAAGVVAAAAAAAAAVAAVFAAVAAAAVAAVVYTSTTVTAAVRSCRICFHYLITLFDIFKLIASLLSPITSRLYKKPNLASTSNPSISRES